MAWVAVAGAGVGLLGNMMADDSGGGQQQSATKEPWAEAAPWLKNQIRQGQQLQDYYGNNPFNPQQQTAYNNTFSDIDNFRGNIAPGLMSLANQGASRVYQRQTGGAPGSVAGYGGAVQPGGMRGNGHAGPFSAPPQQSYGLIDFQAQNPFANGAITAPAPAASDPNEELRRYIEQLLAQQRGGYGGAEGQSDGGYGTGGDFGGLGGLGGDDGAGGYGGADNGYAKGGLVTAGRLSGPDPSGPDDGSAGLDVGEYVITSAMVKRHGMKALQALNEGRASITMKAK